MKRFAFLALLAFTGCAPQIQQFASADVSNAAALATSGGDTQAATCWTALGVTLAPTPTPADDGIAVLAERKRLFQGVATGPCAGVILQTFLQAGLIVP